MTKERNRLRDVAVNRHTTGPERRESGANSTYLQVPRVSGLSPQPLDMIDDSLPDALEFFVRGDHGIVGAPHREGEPTETLPLQNLVDRGGPEQPLHQIGIHDVTTQREASVQVEIVRNRIITKEQCRVLEDLETCSWRSSDAPGCLWI